MDRKPLPSSLANGIYELIKTSEPQGVTLDDLVSLLGDQIHGVNVRQSIGARCGMLSRLGLCERREGFWHVAPPLGKPNGNGNGHSPTGRAKPDSPIAAHISACGEPVEIPPYRQNWAGITLAVASDPYIYEHVISAEFSRDRNHFDPIPLMGDLRFHIGSMTPMWGWEQVSYNHVEVLRIEYRSESKTRRDTIDLNGRALTVARRLADD